MYNTCVNNSKDNLARFGFKPDGSGTHTSRTMMYEDLNLLLSYVSNPNAEKEDYIKAITDNNCLGKRSSTNKSISAKRLIELYSLDPSLTVFRLLRYFWDRDEAGRPLLSLMCAFSRDPLLRKSILYIYSHKEGEPVDRITLEDYLGKGMPGHYSNSTLTSIAQNINSTWTKSGHLNGRAKKYRSKAIATPGSATYALCLGFISGARGESLLTTDYARLLDCSANDIIELSEEASRRGWVVFKRVGNIIEAQFPALLTKEELEWVHEQNR